MSKDWFGNDFDPKRYQAVEERDNQSEVLRVILQAHGIFAEHQPQREMAAPIPFKKGQ